jgi:hypothetical protein
MLAPMPDRAREVQKGPRAGTVKAGEQVLSIPAGWVLLPPGDPGLTRRVKKAGPCWTMSEKRGRKVFSLGVYAPAERIEGIRKELLVEREDPSYERKLNRARDKRAEDQQQYEEDFAAAVFRFLGFAPAHDALAQQLARAISDHAVPVGSGTVARTKRIPIEQRAEAATIAWLRHQTTSYDNMQIARVKGMRREVRRLLAERSRQLLERYRLGAQVAEESCLLRKGLAQASNR